ncbi:hypothetical protein Mapa_010149 [Marchantia paleacea]|nr:hypothetical protein Mapa_010149 [Marchantia paleacea]
MNFTKSWYLTFFSPAPTASSIPRISVSDRRRPEPSTVFITDFKSSEQITPSPFLSNTRNMVCRASLFSCVRCVASPYVAESPSTFKSRRNCSKSTSPSTRASILPTSFFEMSLLATTFCKNPSKSDAAIIPSPSLSKTSNASLSRLMLLPNT